MNINEMIREATGETSPLKDVVKLHGDASYRTYSRAILEDGKSFVLMQMPLGKASVSEEITNFNGTHKELPFINVARYLKKCGVNVPQIFRYFDEEHLMVLEDLGDNLMAGLVEKGDDGVRRNWYRRAIDLLTSLQEKTSSSEASECVAFRRSFDPILLNWEFDHFLEYGVEVRLGKKMTAEDRKVFTDETRKISAKIEKFKYGFTHRDFQSRNILIRNDDLSLVDFQDALMGPEVYDLVALLRDSYVELSPTLLEELVRYYCEKKGRPLESVRREFDLVTCQRKLKDAGRFVYIDRVKKNPDFLRFIPTSLGYIRGALERLPEHAALLEVLKRYVPEWR
jgi:hypothetical protein